MLIKNNEKALIKGFFIIGIFYILKFVKILPEFVKNFTIFIKNLIK